MNNDGVRSERSRPTGRRAGAALASAFDVRAALESALRNAERIGPGELTAATPTAGSTSNDSDRSSAHVSAVSDAGHPVRGRDVLRSDRRHPEHTAPCRPRYDDEYDGRDDGNERKPGHRRRLAGLHRSQPSSDGRAGAGLGRGRRGHNLDGTPPEASPGALRGSGSHPHSLSVGTVA